MKVGKDKLYISDSKRVDDKGREVYPSSTDTDTDKDGEVRHWFEYPYMEVEGADIASDGGSECLAKFIADVGEGLEDDEIATALTTAFKLSYNKLKRQEIRIKHDRVNVTDSLAAMGATFSGKIEGFSASDYATLGGPTSNAANTEMLKRWIGAGKPR